MGATTIPKQDGMVARALALVPAVVIPDDDRQNDYLKTGRVNCNDMVDHPENWPELYGDVGLRWPRRSVCEDNAKITACLWRHHDLVDRRVGKPLSDGSVWGVSLRQISRETGIGEPNERTGKNGRDFPGRRRILRRLRVLHQARFLAGRPQQLCLNLGGKRKRRRTGRPGRYKVGPGNRRFIVPPFDERGQPNRLAGRWVAFPTVRRIEPTLVERLRVSKRMPLEEKDARERRRGRADHFVDVVRRRARDRELKRAQRQDERLARIYSLEQDRQLLAAKTSRRTE